MRPSLRSLISTIFFFFLIISINQQVYSQDDKRTALELVKNNLKDLGLSKSDLDNLYVSDTHTDRLSGALMVYLQQQYKGIIIRKAVYSIAFKNGKVVSAFSSFVARVPLRANSEIPAVSPLTAVNSTARHLNLPEVSSLHQKRVLEVGKSVEFEKTAVSKTDIPVQLVWVITEDSLVKLAWEVHIDPVGTVDMWNVRVDASNGTILEKDNWTRYCQWDKPFPECKPAGKNNTNSVTPLPNKFQIAKPEAATKSNFAFPLTQNASYLVIPYPAEDLPTNGGFQTISTNPWLLAGSNNPAVTYGWHFDGSTDYPYTRGNNVFAQEDRDNNDATDGESATSLTPFPNLNFNYPLNSSGRPDTGVNLRAATTNLFYWNNIMHDISYQYGFDEAAGNFQKDNLGRGGTGNDFVKADVQDNGGFNNANFSTPPDGTSGHMQMYLFSRAGTATINQPGNIAGVIVAKEGIFNQNTILANLGPKTGNLVLYEDSSLAHLACGNPRNGSAISGNIALLDRGTCNYSVKVKNAQNAGAIAVVVINNVPGAPVSMGGTDNSIVIPAIQISLEDGNLIKAELLKNSVVNFTINVPPPFLDGDLDNGIIAHEYTHGISNRLTGGLAGYATCLNNAEQMGEGWSDYYALMVTTDWKKANLTDGPIPRDMAKYVNDGPGFRRYPYTTDTSINKWTYGKLATETGGEAHSVGEIWCATLWDMTWNLIKKDAAINGNLYDINGTGGNSVALKLVTLGLKLQPCSPGFIDGRNAILKADTVLFNGKYSCAIWQAFARRGMGVNARQGSSNRVNDQFQNFDLPGGATITKTSDKNSARQGDEITYTFGVQCGCSPLSGVTIRDTLPNNVIYQRGGTLNGKEVSFSPINLSEQQSAVYNFTVKVNETNTSSVTHLTESVSSATINSEVWASSKTIGNAQWGTFNNGGGDFLFHAPDSATKTDFSLTTVKSYKIDRISTLSFIHYFDTEPGYDGGVVEMSINNGVSWIDAGPYITTNGYNTVIDPLTNSSIAGRRAFSGYIGPYLLPTTIDLSAFAGDSVKFRFRFCSDDAVAGDAWYVDNVVLKSEAGVYNKVFLYKDANLLATSSNRVLMIVPQQLPLPVTLSAFNVVKQNSAAVINWKTSSEINANKFEIERSIDGVSFEVIGTVTVAGFINADKNYQFTDMEPVAGTNYYRLKQIDQDGKFVYSAIRMIVFEDITFNVNLKPNPSNGVFTVNLPVTRDVIQFNVFDSKGILIQKLRLNGGSQLVNLSKVPKGVYILNFVLKDKTIIKKVVIQ